MRGLRKLSAWVAATFLLQTFALPGLGVLLVPDADADGFVSTFDGKWEVQKWGYGSGSNFDDALWPFPQGSVNSSNSLLTNPILLIGCTEIVVVVRDSVGTSNTTGLVLYGSSSPSFVTYDSLVITSDTLSCSAGTNQRLFACISGRFGATSARNPMGYTITPWVGQLADSSEAARTSSLNGIDRSTGWSQFWGVTYLKIRYVINSNAKQVWSRITAKYPDGRPPISGPIGEQ